MNYRNPKLLRAVRDCPVCMSCGRSNDGTIVAAHSNQLLDGKGMGIKAHDYRIAALCSECHFYLDQGRSADKEARVTIFNAAHRKTIGWLFESGVVDCRGRDTDQGDRKAET